MTALSRELFFNPMLYALCHSFREEDDMSYHCPVCQKVWKDTMNLARHILGTGDRPHRQWIESKGFKYADLLLMQTTESGNKAYVTLSTILEKEAQKAD